MCMCMCMCTCSAQDVGEGVDTRIHNGYARIRTGYAPDTHKYANGYTKIRNGYARIRKLTRMDTHGYAQVRTDTHGYAVNTRIHTDTQNTQKYANRYARYATDTQEYANEYARIRVHTHVYVCIHK